MGLLATDPRSVEEIAALLELRPPTISHHLSKLQKVGLVKASAQQHHSVYALNVENLHALSQSLLNPAAILEAASKNLDTDPNDAVRKLLIEPDRIIFVSKGHQAKLVLSWLQQRFEPDTRYTELQVNMILEKHCAHESTTVRRYMVDYKMLARKRDGSMYWRTDSPAAQAPDFDPQRLHPADLKLPRTDTAEQVDVVKRNLTDGRVSVPADAEQSQMVLKLIWHMMGRRFSKGIDYSAMQLDSVIQRFFNDEPAKVRALLVEQHYMTHDTRRDVYKLLDNTPEFDQRVLTALLVDGRLKEIPVLRFIAGKFELRKQYTEQQVNDIIKQYHDDYASLRRYLVSERFMDRKDSLYWLRNR